MTLTAVAAGAYLHHIALASDRPDALAKFYAATLDMIFAQVPVEGPGPQDLVYGAGVAGGASAGHVRRNQSA